MPDVPGVEILVHVCSLFLEKVWVGFTISKIVGGNPSYSAQFGYQRDGLRFLISTAPLKIHC
jgi:hypothetical protein